MGDAISHDSAVKHASGTAIYVDDIPVPENALHLYAFPSPHAHAEITKIDLSQVEKAGGVAIVLCAKDIVGLNDVSPTHSGDDPLLADGLVVFQGQAIFAVAANSLNQARAAAQLAKITYKILPAILSIDEAMAQESYVFAPQVMAQGNAEIELKNAKNTLSGQLKIGGQDHFYLEGQASLVILGEDGDVLVHCSTQHPSEVQAHVAQVLGVERSAVTVEVRRMGGGFGGKETQASPWAALAALVATKTGRPAKMRLVRDDDMIMTGKRHPFEIKYNVGFGDDGLLTALDMTLMSDCGHSLDLSRAINDRALFHSDNCYYIPNMRVTGLKCRTNKVSNTAFRGFGGPQGMMAIEEVMDQIANALGVDPLSVRQKNLYDLNKRNTTHYGMVVEDNVAPKIIEQLAISSDYHNRRADIAAFNANNEFIKKGIALTPLKFGISFTTKFLNQAGALIHIYADGSVQLNHGGTEMGQGLFTKVAQIVANTLNIDLKHIKITATNTGKVPNTSPTAASAGTDMNGMAAKNAADKLIERLRQFAVEHYFVAASDVKFLPNQVEVGEQTFSFKEFVHAAYMERVQLSATGFYATPKINFNPDTGKGRPFLYFSYGASVSEVEVDTLTGESKILRVDILHDVGRSLNPTIDLGQIEGGFIQGMGWLTNEELYWNVDGELKTHAPSTYKIPTISDRPDIFNIALFDNENIEDTIYKSKAVGEPPLMLAISTYRAIWQAVNGNLNAPATPEAILNALTGCGEKT
jgi:xanthine dehydrogenase large subunit